MAIDTSRALAAMTALSAAMFAVYLLIAVIGLRALRRRSAAALASAAPRPGVTILKPLAGADDALESCLESFCALDYPEFEILCGVRELSDPARAIVERVRARHPHVAISLVVTTEGRSLNPKVAQLEVMIRRARHALLWISDSNTRVVPDTLTTMVDDMFDSNASMVVSPVLGVEERSAGSALENLHMSAWVGVSTVAIYWATGLVVAPGKSALIRREALEALGGFEALGRYLGEDFVLVGKLRARGEHVALGRRFVENVNATSSVRTFAARHLRWAQLRWAMVPVSTIIEPMLMPVVPAALYVTLAPSMTSAMTFAAIAVLEAIADLAATAAIRQRALPLRYAPLALVRPFILAAAWLRATVDRRVIWRGNVRWIGPQSVLLDRPRLLERLKRAA